MEYHESVIMQTHVVKSSQHPPYLRIHESCGSIVCPPQQHLLPALGRMMDVLCMLHQLVTMRRKYCLQQHKTSYVSCIEAKLVADMCFAQGNRRVLVREEKTTATAAVRVQTEK